MSYRTRIRTPSFPHLADDPTDVPRRHGRRSDRDLGEHRLRDGGCRPMRSATLLTEAETKAISTIAQRVREPPWRLRSRRCEKSSDRMAGFRTKTFATSPECSSLSPDELDGVATFYNLDLSPTRRPACHPALRQRLLLDHGLRGVRDASRRGSASRSDKRPRTAASRSCRSSASEPATMLRR